MMPADDPTRAQDGSSALASDAPRAEARADRLPPLRDLYPRRVPGRGTTLAAALAAFMLGAASVGLLAWHGDLARLFSRAGAGGEMLPASPTTTGNSARVPALETRLAMLEDRFSRLDQQAHAAAGDAGRAEGLLTAQAVRRAIDRGQSLGYLADQLRLRFADSQPRAVETLIAFAQRPVTLSALDARLDTLAPQLGDAPRTATTWSRLQGALSGLFVIRSDAGTTLGPGDRIAQAKLLLAEGQVDAATAMVAQLPGAAAASGWADEARRFDAAQQALDTIESAAMAPQPKVAPGQI